MGKVFIANTDIKNAHNISIHQGGFSAHGNSSVIGSSLNEKTIGGGIGGCFKV